MTGTPSPKPIPLPDGVTSRMINNVNGLNMHLLEAGNPANPTVVLLHGFPELAYSWRKVIAPTAAAGFHVVAPDQRGFGRTTGWNDSYDADISQFVFTNLVKDIVALVFSLGKTSVHAVIGHDFGSPVAAWCALIRPDIFRSVILMSAPFAGPPSMTAAKNTLNADLAMLNPARTPYRTYYSTPNANADMLNCPEGVFDFMRAYYHVKSADNNDNLPFPLTGFTADEFAKLPTYYVMISGKTMPETVRAVIPATAPGWLTDEELLVYSTEYERTGFQGGLNWYRCSAGPLFTNTMSLFAGKKIEVPTWFVAGKADWGRHQTPGAYENLTNGLCSDFQGAYIIDKAGHWVQQEQPQAVLDIIIPALADLPTR